MSSPVWGWVLAGVYLCVIFVGKRVMASREALSVRPLVLGYNAAMVGLNLYMAVEIFRNAFFVLGYGFRCNGVDYSARGAGMAAVLWWIAIRFTPGGECFMSAMINSCVHVIMYSYYGLKALGYDVWWKRYLTQIQMAQFCFLMFHASYGAVFDCGVFPTWMAYALVAYMISMLSLFLNFYLRSYSGPKAKSM